MLAVLEGKDDVALGETKFNIAKFYDHKQSAMCLPIRDDFFKLSCKVSVVHPKDGHKVGCDVPAVLAHETESMVNQIPEKEIHEINRKSIRVAEHVSSAAVYAKIDHFEFEKLREKCEELTKHNHALKKEIRERDN
jgi:hypothetical protein